MSDQRHLSALAWFSPVGEANSAHTEQQRKARVFAPLGAVPGPHGYMSVDKCSSFLSSCVGWCWGMLCTAPWSPPAGRRQLPIAVNFSFPYSRVVFPLPSSLPHPVCVLPGTTSQGNYLPSRLVLRTSFQIGPNVRQCNEKMLEPRFKFIWLNIFYIKEKREFFIWSLISTPGHCGRHATGQIRAGVTILTKDPRTPQDRDLILPKQQPQKDFLALEHLGKRVSWQTGIISENPWRVLREGFWKLDIWLMYKQPVQLGRRNVTLLLPVSS